MNVSAVIFAPRKPGPVKFQQLVVLIGDHEKRRFSSVSENSPEVVKVLLWKAIVSD
jgi:hypothetical protein